MSAWDTIRPQLTGLKATGGNGDYEAVCPLGDHKSGKPFSINPDKGVWRCFNGHGAGTFKQLSERLGLTKPRALPVLNWGLDAAMTRLGVKNHEHGVIFPVRDHEGNECRSHVRRHDGNPRFQFWGEGRTYHALVNWPVVNEWGAGVGIAYVVEGNRDWLALAAHDYPSIGILGTESFEEAYSDAFPYIRQAGIGALVITPDNDAPGLAAAKRWMSFLRATGWTVGIRILPGVVNGVEVKDVFDFFVASPSDFDSRIQDVPVVWP